MNSKFGTRTAVMLGDFFFAESSAMLAELANQEVRSRNPAASSSCGTAKTLSSAGCDRARSAVRPRPELVSQA